MVKMRVLIACEFSQIVTEAFIRRGHYAVSCDFEQPEKSYPHIQDDVLRHLSDGWDLMIAHPPCTYLCRNRAYLNKLENQEANIKEARDFFLALLEAPIPKICIENPVPSRGANLPKYSQIIQPWQFGHDYSKKTCLWLRNLPQLTPTEIIEITYITTPSGKRYTSGWYKMPRKTKDRSRTFRGIASAMAEQWGE